MYWNAGEKRVDSADGTAYTYDELAAFYKGKYKQKDIDAFWEACKPVGKAKKAKQDKAVAEPTKYDYSQLWEGTRVQVELQGTWYAADVVTVAKGKNKAKAPVKIHFAGWAAESDEWVGGDRIRSKAITKAAASTTSTKASAAAPAKAAAASGAVKYDYAGLEKDMRIQVELGGVWYAANVVTVKKKGGKAPVKVNFAGYGAETDEWVGGDRIRSKALGKTSAAAPAQKKAAAPAQKTAAPAQGATKYDYSGLEKDMRVQAEMGGVWYAANVVTVKKGKNAGKAPVKVNYAGYGADSDEWVGGDRIRSKALGKAAAPASAPAKAGKADAKKAAAPAAGKYDYSGLTKDMRLQAESQGVWYAANVVTISTAKNKSKAPVKVNFAGYGPESDEWVGGDRLRSKALKSA